MQKKNILLIYNPAAQGGNAKKVKNLYLEHLETREIDYSITETSEDGTVKNLTEHLGNKSFDVISIIGGDGTLNLVLNALPQYDIPLHIIPAGSGNDFVKSLYKNLSLPSIFNLPFSENTKIEKVDLWNCNHHKFINAFGVGFDGSIVRSMNKRKSWFPSKMKYWVEILRHLLFYLSNEFEVNGIKQKAFMITCANGKIFGGDFKIAPRARISDKRFDLVIVKKLWIPLRPFYLPILQLGKHLNLSVIDYSQRDSLVIKSEKPIAAQIDGEFLTEKSYHISYSQKIEFLNQRV